MESHRRKGKTLRHVHRRDHCYALDPQLKIESSHELPNCTSNWWAAAPAPSPAADRGALPAAACSAPQAVPGAEGQHAARDPRRGADHPGPSCACCSEPEVREVQRCGWWSCRRWTTTWRATSFHSRFDLRPRGCVQARRLQRAARRTIRILAGAKARRGGCRHYYPLAVQPGGARHERRRGMVQVSTAVVTLLR